MSLPASPLVVNALIAVLLFFAAVVLENRVGFLKRVQVAWHKLMNTEARYKVAVEYKTGLDFGNIKDEIKSVLRERYTQVDVLTDGSKTLQVNVDEDFNITVTNAEKDVLALETSKITSTMRRAPGSVRETMELLRAVTERNQDQAEGTSSGFEELGFEATLILPYSGKFYTFHAPLGFTVTRHDIQMHSVIYNADITDEGDSITIQADYLDDLETVLKRLV